jgi:ABC-type bacteriocin/lantibiotic exporter with double-glycine peptidase domain
VIAILIYHASLFLLLFLLLAPGVAILGWILKSRLKRIRQNIKKTSTETLKTLKEALAGYVESNIYSKDEFFVDRYIKQQEQLNHNIQAQQILQSLPSRLIEIFAVFGFFILIVVNKWSAHGAPVDLLTIGIFVAAAYKIIPGIVKILNSAGQMKTYEFVLSDLTTVDPKQKLAREGGEQIKSIRLDKIHFSYNSRPILEGIDLEAIPGDFVGISSGSGRGKTTLIHLLLGFIDQQDGIIAINGHIQTAADRRNYWNRVSYIKQQPFLIHDSIARNIALQENGFDEKKLNEVITFCGLDGLLAQYPEGINFLVTENGRNLSGGQRQRLMLARALYHDFDLLILDEPFGELDQESGNLILEKLQQFAAQGKIILFITHNKSSLAYCNKLISFDEQA